MILFKLLSIFLILCAIYSFFKTIQYAFKTRILTALRHLASTLVFSSLASIIFLLCIAISQWQIATDSRPIANLYIQKAADYSYRIKLNLQNNSDDEYYLISGDQWELSAQIIQPKPWLSFFNLKPLYRFSTLSGLYNDIELERTSIKTIYPIEAQSKIDLWHLIKTFPTIASFFIQAKYGNAVFMPLHDHAHYLIYLTNSGLTSRLQNN